MRPCSDPGSARNADRALSSIVTRSRSRHRHDGIDTTSVAWLPCAQFHGWGSYYPPTGPLPSTTACKVLCGEPVAMPWDRVGRPPILAKSTVLWEPVGMGLRQSAAAAARHLPLGVHEMVPSIVRRPLRHRLGRYYAWESGFDHHLTPALAPGEENGPPEFVGIGVQKAGTSWWYQLIASHPKVSGRPSIHKERHFFTRFGTESFGASDIADYGAWFPRQAGTISGEWTPAYFDCPWVPSLLAQADPEAKLLLILRDPVQRFRSGMAHQIRGGADHVGSLQVRAIRRSLYTDDLKRWLEYFPAEQLLVLQYEACVADPAAELQKTFRFLGLDGYEPPDLRRSVNRTSEGKADLPKDAVARLREIVAPDITAVASLVPELDLSLWPSASGSA